MDIQKAGLRKNLEDCRQGTLALFETVENDLFCQQIHSEFSPIGWHLGHIAFTEAYWLLEKCQGLKPLFPEYRKLFAADGLPKCERQNLPSLEIIKNYLEIVRLQVWDYLEQTSLLETERLWWWLLQHESQHGETIAFLLHLHHVKNPITNKTGAFSTPPENLSNVTTQTVLNIPAGSFWMGSDRLFAQDNERPRHLVNLESYWIDSSPVTQGQYQEFIAKDGYQQAKFWTEEGWQWRQTQGIEEPLYWLEGQGNAPVYGVSWYEAQAYANFVGKRLPTEAEWEKASYHQDFYPQYPQRSVWEWTNSWFAPYPNFEPYPYSGYSQVYFDQQHRVLRGGSWVTRPWALRKTFRNWYHPWVREIFVGFRCAD